MPQRILVVDDDKSIVKVLSAYLEQSGYQVLPAYDGEMALHTMRRERPDLVILDLMMPHRDGWEVTNLVRADQALAATPIIMLTARVEDTDKIVGLELGADDYITKPFNAREVVARVKSLRNNWLPSSTASIAATNPAAAKPAAPVWDWRSSRRSLKRMAARSRPKARVRARAVNLWYVYPYWSQKSPDF